MNEDYRNMRAVLHSIAAAFQPQRRLRAFRISPDNPLKPEPIHPSIHGCLRHGQVERRRKLRYKRRRKIVYRKAA